MFSFASYLQEDAQGKNLHLEHLEDEILNFGIGGARGAINFLQKTRDMLSGNARSSINMTVKWDGPLLYSLVLILLMANSLSQRSLYSIRLHCCIRQEKK